MATRQGGETSHDAAIMTQPTEAESPDGMDLILLLIGVPGSPRPFELDGITRLEKLIYLAEREGSLPTRVREAFTFKPYDYGPYSKDVYEAADLLERFGLLTESRVYQGSGLDEMEEVLVGADREGVERRFILTENGRVVAQELANRYPQIAATLQAIKGRYGRMSLQQLLQYVYTNYPESAAKSVIRRRVLG